LYEFARLYEEGKVFKRDYTEALRLYTASNNLYIKKERKDFIFSAAKLGVFYEKGLGCEQNYEMAVHFYNIIKDTNYKIPDAFINYAKMLEEGRGVEKNIKAANKLFYKAASCGNKEALDRYKKKAENGKFKDIYNLASLYEQNHLFNEAKSLYCQLSEKGFKHSIEKKLKGIFYYNEYVNIDLLYNRISV
jgi:TPR repeat protein